MSMTLKDWRKGMGRWVVVSALFCGPVAISLAKDAPATDPPQDVDPATKKLMAANGLYQRQLYKLAADAYKDFLDQNPRHDQAPAARYAMAVCLYRQGDYAGAIP